MGDEPCMLFTFADLERRRKAETALQHSEERFAKAFRLSPVPTVLVKLDTLPMWRSTTPSRPSFGYAEAEVLRAHGRRTRHVGRSPRQRDTFRAALAETGHVVNFETCLRRTRRRRARLPDLGRARHDRRRGLHPVGHPRHHGAQAQRARSHGGHRGGHGRHVLVQPRRHRAARRLASAGPRRARQEPRACRPASVRSST